MHLNQDYYKNIWLMILVFIVYIILSWVALSLVLMWFKPSLYNSEGNVDWSSTLWISVLSLVISMLVLLIVYVLLLVLYEPLKQGKRSY
jgi:hypothetical protein